MSKKELEHISKTIEIKQAPKTVNVCTYKSSILLQVPGQEPVWLDADTAEKLADALRSVVKRRRALDARGNW